MTANKFLRLQCTTRLFFTTIAAQLVQCLPVVAEYVRNAIKADANIAKRALGDQIRKLILEPVEAVPHSVSRTITVVIDALDECEGDQDVTAVITFLLQKDRPVVAAEVEIGIESGVKERMGLQEGVEILEIRFSDSEALIPHTADTV